MYQTVFGAKMVDRVLNASLTVVDVQFFSSSSSGSGGSPSGEVVFDVRVVNDVSHLAANDLITTRSTAL